MAIKKDFEGFCNVLREINFEEDDFAMVVLMFIDLKCPKVDTTNLLNTEEGDALRHALYKVFKRIKEIDSKSKVHLYYKRCPITKSDVKKQNLSDTNCLTKVIDNYI